MTTKLILTGLLLAGLHRAAGAQPVAPPSSSVRLALSIKVGADVRTHELVISDRGCGVVKEKAAQYEDDVRLCSAPTAQGLVLEIEGTVRAGTSEYHQRSQATVARTGASFEVGRTNGVRFAVRTI